MSHNGGRKKNPVINFLFENSIFLVAGAVGALALANTVPESYNTFIDYDLRSMVGIEVEDHDVHAQHEHHEDHEHHDPHEGEEHDEHAEEHHAHNLWTPKNVINDILMALFFAIAAKEVFESMLPGGALSDTRKAATPLIATLGGIVGPAGLYLAGALMLGQAGAFFGQEGVMGRGWAIPCATDIAFSYLVARLIFGAGHPAIAFLLLLAIADDAAGLMILAFFYPQAELQPMWFLATALAVVIGLGFKKLGLRSFWWYLLGPGTLSWISFHEAGIHAALGLVPVVFTMPHAHIDYGWYVIKHPNGKKLDTLNDFEHWWKPPVEIILGLFGLVNAGVLMSSVGSGTTLVLIGLLIGKPLGITLFTWIAEKLFKLEVPEGMGYHHILTLGMVAGIGFTVALFVSEAAFPSANASFDGIRDQVKMGALGSFAAGFLAWGLAKVLGIRPLKPSPVAKQEAPDDSCQPEWQVP